MLFMLQMRLLRLRMSIALHASATPVIVAGGRTLPLKKGDLIEYRCPMTGMLRLGMILVCNQALLFYITVFDIEKGKEVWIRSQNIIALKDA
jgi:hypothetical protein